MCPTEFRLAVFTDGELPEAEAREMALHLDTCDACSILVSKLQAESRMFVQCLQDVDLAEEVVESVPQFQPAASPVSIGRFALGVGGAALAFRLSTGILFGMPGWLDPRTWVSGVGIAFDAALYAIQNGQVAFNEAVQTVAVISLGGLLLAGMARVVKHGHITGALLSVFVAMGFFSSPSYAMDFRKGMAASLPAGQTVDDTLVVSPGDAKDANRNIDIAGIVKGDLIAVGDTVLISGTVEGNAVIAARRVEITGSVHGSLIIGGAAIVVSGKIGGSVVVLGSDIRLTGEVARNYLAAGANLNATKTSQVGGNLMSFGAESVIDGTVVKDIYAGGAIAELRGSARNVDFSGAQIRLTSTARVAGDLSATIQRSEQVLVDPSAVVSGKRNITIQPRRQQSRYRTSSYYFWEIVWMVAAFVTGWVLFRIAPWLAPTSVSSGKDWLKASGLGLAALVTVPVASFIALFTVVGIPLALMTFGLWIAACYFAKIIVAEFVGRMLLKKRSAVSLLTGLAIVILAMNLPMLGGLIGFLFLLLGLGAIVMTVYRMANEPKMVVEAI